MRTHANAVQFYLKIHCNFGLYSSWQRAFRGPNRSLIVLLCSITCFVRSHGRPNLLVFLAASAALVYPRASAAWQGGSASFGPPGPRAHGGRAAG